jgi:hypothetical protein
LLHLLIRAERFLQLTKLIDTRIVTGLLTAQFDLRAGAAQQRNGLIELPVSASPSARAASSSSRLPNVASACASRSQPFTSSFQLKV